MYNKNVFLKLALMVLLVFVTGACASNLKNKKHPRFPYQIIRTYEAEEWMRPPVCIVQYIPLNIMTIFVPNLAMNITGTYTLENDTLTFNPVMYYSRNLSENNVTYIEPNDPMVYCNKRVYLENATGDTITDITPDGDKFPEKEFRGEKFILVN